MNTEERFTELETKLVYCEDLIQHLNAALSSQQLQMDDLRLAVKVLSERLKEASTPQQRALMPGDERPPHY
jgi:SlyX protein